MNHHICQKALALQRFLSALCTSLLQSEVSCVSKSFVLYVERRRWRETKRRMEVKWGFPAKIVKKVRLHIFQEIQPLVFNARLHFFLWIIKCGLAKWIIHFCGLNIQPQLEKLSLSVFKLSVSVSLCSIVSAVFSYGTSILKCSVISLLQSRAKAAHFILSSVSCLSVYYLGFLYMLMHVCIWERTAHKQVLQCNCMQFIFCVTLRANS